MRQAPLRGRLVAVCLFVAGIATGAWAQRADLGRSLSLPTIRARTASG